MRSRLFSILLIPAVTAVVLAWLAVAGSNAQVNQATVATSNAELYQAVAELDHALGVEAMRSAELYRNETIWHAAKWNVYVTTNTAIIKLTETANENPGAQSATLEAVEAVNEALDYRPDIEAGVLSPLQIIDLYRQARRQLLDRIQEVSLDETASDPDLIAILALVEARSAHLNERLAVDLAITYDQWAPGQHSAAITAIVSHDTYLNFAASYQQIENLQISAELQALRDQVEITTQTPSIDNTRWQQISNQWLTALNNQIEESIDQTTARLDDSQNEANSQRRTLVVAVAILMLTAMFLMLWVAYRLIWRVEAITEQASLLAQGLRSTSASSVVGGNDEITSLAYAFDDMAGELSKGSAAQKVESQVLEAIAEGLPIGAILSTICDLLEKDQQGYPLYRFVTEEPSPTIPSINNPSSHQTPLWIDKNRLDAPDLDVTNDQTRTAIGLATMAQRRADDDAQLEGQANFDPLTGLLNRRKIMQIAEDAVNSSSTNDRTPSLIYIDLDNFKKLNDSHGHSAGDQILRATADALTKLTVPIGAWAGRVGGDEFIVVLPDTASEKELQAFTTNAVKVVSELHKSEGEHLSVGVSIGAVKARNGASLEQLLSDADIALYAAKEAGRGQAVISDNELRTFTSEEAVLTTEVLAALENQEFVAWYQPIWGDNGTNVAALEALVRWNHPDGTVRRPDSFLTILEQQHSLARLDRLMFDRVCADISSWVSRTEKVVPVHINVSPMRLEEHGFIEQTIATLRRTAVHPEHVVVEVVESGLMTDISSNGARLQQLRDVGILIATDDFGQGYSSLSYLRDLKFDILKIDRQFIDQIDSVPTNQSIVAAVVGLAQSLNLTVVAEGIERPEELEWLLDAGCELIQGFLLGKPAPEPEVRALLSTKRDPRIAPSQGALPKAITRQAFETNLQQEAEL